MVSYMHTRTPPPFLFCLACVYVFEEENICVARAFTHASVRMSSLVLSGKTRVSCQNSSLGKVPKLKSEDCFITQ